MFLFLTSFNSVKTAIMPLVLIALILDFAIVGIWWLIGTLLNNSKVKEGAKEEAYQAIGTAILAVIIIGSLLTLAITFDNVLSSTNFFYGPSSSIRSSSVLSSKTRAPLNPGTIDTLCNNLYKTSPLDIIGKNSGNSFLTSKDNQFPGLCSLTSLDSATRHIDYPLVASGIILANITNQTGHNLNNLFILDSFIGYLSTVTPTMSWCIPAPEDLFDPIATVLDCSAATSLSSGFGGIAAIATLPVLYIRFAFTPYAGYDIVYKELGTIGILITTAFDSFIAQLLFVIISLYAWPWLIFSGFVLRSTIFTRKIGGLLIAIGLGMVLIFPAVFSLEYLGLGNGIGNLISTSPSSCISNPSASGCVAGIYGFNTIETKQITFIPGYPSNKPETYSAKKPVQYPYDLNFFIEPQLNKIAYYYQCWPTNNNIILGESLDTIELLVPFSSGVQLFASGASIIPTFFPKLEIDPNCSPHALLRVFFKYLESYGIIGITAFFLPIINLFIVISAIIGLSGLFGGDTSLAGLSKLI